MTKQDISSNDVIQFWFHEIAPKAWWQKDLYFDQDIKKRFGKIHTAATQGELEAWRQTAEGRLAEIIVLDQFSRNIYRDTPLAFAYDATALVLAQEAIRISADQQVDFDKRTFFYMPYMHSESAHIHTIAIELFSQPGAEFNYDFELKHKVIIDRFGRYPHRNAILNRESSPEEVDFLAQPDSSF